jgi:hypothetical protein
MEAKSMKKLMKAGYMFIRPDDSPNIRLKYRKEGSGDWKTLEKFETKAVRDRRYVELLDSEEFIISDSY